MADIDTINTVMATKTVIGDVELDPLPVATSNETPLTTQVVEDVITALRQRKSFKKIKEQAKIGGISLSWSQIKLIYKKLLEKIVELSS